MILLSLLLVAAVDEPVETLAKRMLPIYVREAEAYSMAVDRDLFLDVVYSIPKFRQAGLPIETRWNSATLADEYKGWWLDPKSKDFGPNAKYYQHDIAEAKKLIAAAGATVRIPVVAYPITVAATLDPSGLELAIRSTAPDGICTNCGIYFQGKVASPLFQMYSNGIRFVTGRVHARRNRSHR